MKSRNGGTVIPCEARFPRHLTAKVERQERSSGRNRRGVEDPKHFHTVWRLGRRVGIDGPDHMAEAISHVLWDPATAK